MSSDDDWFERAFDDTDSAEEREDEPTDTTVDAEDEPTDTTVDAEDEPTDTTVDAEEEPADATVDTENDQTVAPDEGADEQQDASDTPEAFEASTDASSQRAVDTPAEDSPFSEDFSAAFNSAPDPGFDGDGDTDANADGAMTAGAGSASAGQPQPGGFGGGDDAAFGSFEEMGFGGTDFDESDLDSDLERLDIGIEGLDEMILGGIPRQSLITTIGSAGTGKTTIGMQFLNEALENGERGVYITLEESRQRVLDTAEEKGWSFREYEDDGMLAIVDLDPIEMANSLSSIRNDLTRLIDDYCAERLVLDSVSLLEMMYDHPARRRSEVFQFTRALKKAGVTTLVTSEASGEDPFASRHGIIEYLADAVLILQYVRSNNFQETRLAIEIQKIRDANHSRQPKPYEITNDGISVHQQANLF